MKLTTFIIMILFSGFVILAFVGMSNDLNTQFPNETYINTSTFSTRYDFSSSINSSMGTLLNKFNQIEDEDNGFFTKLAAGIEAVPYAVILFPSLALSALSHGSAMLTNFGQDIALPLGAIFILIVILAIYVISKLLEFFQKTPT